MTGYTPADLAAALAAGVPTILGYVGAGVGGAVVLFVAFVGIRAALRFFSRLVFWTADERGIDRDYTRAQKSGDWAAFEAKWGTDDI